MYIGVYIYTHVYRLQYVVSMLYVSIELIVNSYWQILMSVNIEMEVVYMGVITPLALITAPAILDINCILIGINVKVRTVTIELIIIISM